MKRQRKGSGRSRKGGESQWDADPDGEKRREYPGQVLKTTKGRPADSNAQRNGQGTHRHRHENLAALSWWCEGGGREEESGGESGGRWRDMRARGEGREEKEEHSAAGAGRRVCSRRLCSRGQPEDRQGKCGVSAATEAVGTHVRQRQCLSRGGRGNTCKAKAVSQPRRQ